MDKNKGELAHSDEPIGKTLFHAATKAPLNVTAVTHPRATQDGHVLLAPASDPAVRSRTWTAQSHADLSKSNTVPATDRTPFHVPQVKRDSSRKHLHCPISLTSFETTGKQTILNNATQTLLLASTIYRNCRNACSSGMRLVRYCKILMQYFSK